MSKFYDRQGLLITLMEWAEKFENRDYKTIKQDTLEDGTLVSTVWLGLDHNWGDGPPLIFETMIFRDDSGSEEYVRRYSTEEEAEQGHVIALFWIDRKRSKENHG